MFEHECFKNGKETRMVRLYRRSHKLYEKNHKRLAWFIRNIIRIVYTSQIHPAAEIGHPAHFGHGINLVIGAIKTGNRIDLSHSITIAAGTEIGNNFFMGPGARIIRPVKIGNNVRIGANAVITKDIPDNTLATGIPAKYYPIKKNQ
jgi:serine O-acetyltransferase